MKIRVATCVPKQTYTQAEKLAWLDKAIAENPCDLFLTSQEYFGGGSIREICKEKGIFTNDVPVTEDWLRYNVGSLAVKYGLHIGVGASVARVGETTEDFLYFDPKGNLIGYHSKIALPVQDNIALGGASGITPEINYKKAVTVIEIPALGLRVGTVFCWQVFFRQFWNDLSAQKCNLVVHPIKFAPRAWYQKGLNTRGDFTRTGFTQNKGSELPEDDTLGWIRKLKYESEFKQLPIAVTCNTWDGGEKYLALVGWVDEVTHNTNLFHLPSVASTEKIVVTEYDPELYLLLMDLNDSHYAQFKDVFGAISEKIMMRKALKIEQKALDGNTVAIDRYLKKPETKAKQPDQQEYNFE